MDGNLFYILLDTPNRNPKPAQLLSIGSTDLFGAQFLGERHVGLVPEKNQGNHINNPVVYHCATGIKRLGPNPGSQTYKNHLW